ncbi:MAG: hypothetical protein R3Y36_02990 [Spirochaetales bacterium]
MKRLCFCLIGIVFFSCADSTPLIDTVKAVVLYDYSSESDSPQMRMGVFVSVSSPVQRFQSFTMDFTEENYTWTTNNPVSVKNAQDSLLWIGHSHILPATSEGFLPGQYRITYTDLAERTGQLYFTLPSLLSVDEIDTSLYTEKTIAVYNDAGRLLYYGGDADMGSDEIILQKFPDAASMNAVLFSPDGITGIVEATHYFAKNSDVVAFDSET